MHTRIYIYNDNCDVCELFIIVHVVVEIGSNIYTSKTQYSVRNSYISISITTIRSFCRPVVVGLAVNGTAVAHYPDQDRE